MNIVKQALTQSFESIESQPNVVDSIAVTPAAKAQLKEDKANKAAQLHGTTLKAEPTILMNGPLSTIFTRALQIAYAKPEVTQTKSDEDALALDSTAATLESEANDYINAAMAQKEHASAFPQSGKAQGKDDKTVGADEKDASTTISGLSPIPITPEEAIAIFQAPEESQSSTWTDVVFYTDATVPTEYSPMGERPGSISVIDVGMNGNNWRHSIESISIHVKLKEENVSMEGFVSGLFDWFKGNKKKETDQEKPSQDLYHWLKDNVNNGKLNPLLKLTGKPVEVSKTHSNSFYRGQTTFLNTEAIVSAYKQDLSQLSSIANKALPCAKAAIDILNRFKKATDVGAAYEDYEVLKKIILSFKNKLPTPFVTKFSEPTYQFIGNYKTGFLAKSDDTNVKHKVWADDEEPDECPSVTLSPLNQSDLNKLLNLAIELGKFSDKTYEITEEGVGIDGTDAPFRHDELGYDKEALAIFEPYTHPQFDELYTTIFFNLFGRTTRLEQAIWTYIRKSTTLKDPG